MRSIGTLYEPPGSWKKCSGELRSRSTDWRGQKVPGGKQNCKKGRYGFGPGRRSDDGMLLTTKIMVVLCSRSVWKRGFGVSNWTFVANLMKNGLLTIFVHSNSSNIWNFDFRQNWIFCVFPFRSKFIFFFVLLVSASISFHLCSISIIFLNFWACPGNPNGNQVNQGTGGMQAWKKVGNQQGN